MELKTKLQYTYFIYPYVVKENKYEKYVLKLLKNKKCKLKLARKEKDLEMYEFFLPTIRDYLFKSFSFSEAKMKRFEKLEISMKSAILSGYPCTIFEYEIGHDAQGKVGTENGIFFIVEKINIICFSSGICFLVFKTTLNDSNDFDDVINFNYKFREINSDTKKLKKYENIKIQTSTFNDMKDLSDIIEELSGNDEYSKGLDINTNQFYTYSYTCLDQNSWGETNDFSNIEIAFNKYVNVLPSVYHLNGNSSDMQIISDGKYIKIGITKTSCNLLSSSLETNNYTKLAATYESEYFYTYIISLYKKIFLKKMQLDFENLKHKALVQFISFTNKLWKYEITNKEKGSLFYDKINKALGLDIEYMQVKSKYELMYKAIKVDKNAKVNKAILALLIISVIINIINFVLVFKRM